MNISGCIVCGCTDNLNTDMSIVVDGDKIIVHACDEHAEDLTPKAAKTHYLEKKSKIDEVIAQAKALGLNISAPTNGSGLVVAKQSTPVQQPQQRITPEPTDEELIGDEVVDKRKVDHVMHQRVKGMSGAVGKFALESYTALDPNSLQSQLPEELTSGVAKLQLVEGRQGEKICIPSIVRDGTGTTKINVKKYMDDHELQRRFKELANSDMDGYNTHSFSKDGYQLTQCPVCKNSKIPGEIVVGQGKTIDCPKCGGALLI